MSDEMTFTLHSPLTEEEWDMITDVDLDHTPEITFHTKHGKEVVFVKRKTGKWIQFPNHMAYKCSECGRVIQTTDGQRNVSKHYPFCHCGADMRKEEMSE